LIELIDEESNQNGATWLLKYWFENENSISKNQIHALIKKLPNLKNWEAILHVLQTFPYIKLSYDMSNSAYHFIHENLNHKNKFVRAWAYNGLYQLSIQFSIFKEETTHLLNRAMAHEAPSVKARIRNILK